MEKSISYLGSLWPLAVLLMLEVLRPSLAEAIPGTTSTGESFELGLLLAALIAPLLLSCSHFPSTMLAGAAILVAPHSGTLFGLRSLPPTTVLIAATLTPAVLAVALAQREPDSEISLSARLWPSLAACSGLLLLLAQPSLTDIRADLAIMLLPLLTGLGAAFSQCREAYTFRGTASTPFVLSAAVLAPRAWSSFHAFGNLHEVPVAAALDAARSFLLLFSLDHAGPERWSSQFTLLPLILLLEGPFLLGIHLHARDVLGLLLLLAASIRLLLARETVH